MGGGGAQGDVAGGAQSDLDGFVRFVHVVVDHGKGDGLGGLSVTEGKRPSCQGVVGPGPCGAAAADGVIHGDRLAGHR